MFIDLTLEKKVYETAKVLGMKKEKREDIRDLLDEMLDFDDKLYSHSMRVALLCYDIGKNEKVNDLEKLFCGALSHDIGKTQISKDLFNRNLSKSDFEKVKAHTVLGYNMLRITDIYSAYMALMHHYFGDNPYPKNPPEIMFKGEEGRNFDKNIVILSTADFYDAAKTRNYHKFKMDMNDPNHLEKIMKKHYSNDQELVARLFKQNLMK